MESNNPPNVPAESIVCRVTPWYFRRMGILAGMLLLMGLYFLYDGAFGYPKANGIAEQKEWFEREVLGGYDAAKAAGTLDVWMTEARTKGWPTGSKDEPPRWVSWAAQRGWPENPVKFTQREIDEQFWWGGGTIAAGGIVGVVILLNRRKVLRGESDHWVTPEGVAIRYGDVFRIDKRPWAQKGLAYIWYRPEGTNREAKAVIDDLKYAGAERVLTQLLVHFKGELIEKVANEDEETTPADADDGKGI